MSHWELLPQTPEEPLLSGFPDSPGSLLFGYSVYTTFRMPISERWLDAHLQRLKRDAFALGLAWRYADHQVMRALSQVFTSAEPIIRLTVFAEADGYGQLYDRQALPSRMLISSRSASPPRTEGIRLQTVHAQRSLPTHKHGAMADMIQIQRHVRLAGFDDALLINQAGHYAECTTANIFFIKDDQLFTPLPERDACLPGITRQQILESAHSLGISVSSEPIGAVTPFQGAFLTNAAQGLVRVASIDETVLPWPTEVLRITNTLAASLLQ